MSDPTAPGDGEDAAGDLLSTAAAPAAPDARPGGVAGRASALRSAEAPRGKMGTPGSNKPMITTVAPWALPSRTGQATGTRRRRAPPSFAVPSFARATDGKDTTAGLNTTSPSESANVVHEVKILPATYATRQKNETIETETIETIESEFVERPRGTTNEDTPSVPSVPLPPRAFLDECPGLSDRAARLDVRFMTYGELFATAKTNKTRIVVPTFQRTYCWTDTMARTFFRDVALRRGSTAARVKGGHGTGKCLFRRVPARDDDENETKKSLLCLDGQQRCTTVALSLAAIRDAAVVLLAKEKDETDADAFRRRTVLEETARKADSALFLERDDFFDTGEKKTIFFPSRADRAAFAACVGASDEGGFFLREKERTGKEPRVNFLVAAKRALHLEASALSPFALADALEAALKDASLTYVEIFGPDKRVDLAQAFQWLQEKTLFAASAVLWNATPGLKFAACDLARNYLMASTLRLPVEAQEETYLTQWLLPLESRVVEKRNREEDEAFSEDPETKTGRTSHPSEAFDAFLKAFLDDDDARFAARVKSSPSRRVQRRTRRMCAMERDLRRMLLSEHAPESTKRSAGLDTAVWTYARFRSFAERVSMGREDEIEDDKSATDDSRSEFRVDFTTSAPPPSWEGPAPADAAPAESRERVRSPEERGDPGDPPSARDAEPPPVPVDDAARREVLRRLVAFGEKAGFLA